MLAREDVMILIRGEAEVVCNVGRCILLLDDN
jgi:hypothetical protein